MSPTGSILQPIAHSYLAPPFEKANVADAMRMGVVSCSPETSLREVARIMATYRIHFVVVSEMEGDRPWGVVSDIDLAGAAGPDSARLTAREVARTELVTVAPDDSMARAAQLMADHGVTHLLVIQPQTGHPVGVLSTLDLAGVLAWGGSA